MVIGIDLGTTYTAIAYLDKDNNPQIITNSEGGRTTPSAVMFEEDGSVIVGQIAKESAIIDGINVVEFIKNEMGNPNYKYRINENIEYTPEEISALILKKLKSDAESFLGEKVTKAVITVPAYFNDAQRKATQDAGVLAELEVLKIINEPTAAAIAFGVESKLNNSNILVYDLGGGTFDATIVHYSDNDIIVKATDGIRRIGGHFFDQEIVSFVIKQFKDKHNIDLYDDNHIDSLQELNKRAEDSKIHLNARKETYISVSCDGVRDRIKITRVEFNELIKRLYERTERVVLNTLRDADLTWEDIDKILLVGGASRTEYVRERLRELSGKEPSSQINPDEAVAIGAAIQASIIYKSEEDLVQPKVKIVDVSSHGVGIITMDALTRRYVNNVIIDRNTQLPAQSSRKFFTSEEDQEIIQLEVTEGEYTDIEDTNIIGKFEIEIPRGLKKGSEVEIEILVDESQIIHVYTRILSVGNFFKEIHIERNSNLNKDQIVKKKDLISKLAIG